MGQLGAAYPRYRRGGRNSAGDPAGGRPRDGPAEVAWVVVRAAQGRGYAKEAARSLVAVLQEAGWTVIAHIHPGHLASQRVARAAGLSPTTDIRDGEVRWVRRLRRLNLGDCAHVKVLNGRLGPARPNKVSLLPA